MNDTRTENGRHLFVVSAPSGAGKSTLTQTVVSRHPDIRLSISCTTRPRRGDERHGREYFFLNQEEFSRMIERGEFLEWAQVHGHYYGTSRAHVEDLMKQGFKVLFDIDVQGAASLKKQYREATLIFIAPPSRAELERRLRERKTDDPAEIKKRLRNALGEIYQAKTYDHVIVNDDLAAAVAQLEAVLLGRRLAKEDNEAILARLLSEFRDDSAGA
ncbi:MAG: guanylate kinase [Myxococcales bacterium]|nr:MAG: guanylate kinase [Myxococcales bacterium]